MVEFDAVHPVERYRPVAQDPHPRLGAYRLTDASALAGSGVWVLLVGAVVLSDLPASALWPFHALALLVVTPLALGLAATRRRSGGDSLAYRVAVLGQPPAGLTAVGAVVFQPAGPLRGALFLPWLGVGLAAGAFALWRLGSRGLLPLPELAVDASLLALPAGALVFLLGGGSPPAGLPTAPYLGAVHAHYAGIVLPLLAGRAGRIGTNPGGRTPRTAGGRVAAAATLVLAMVGPLLAVATLDDGAFGLAAVVLVALAAVALAPWLLWVVVPALGPRPGVLLAVAALSLVVTMALPPVAAVTDLVDARAMVAWHGTLAAAAVALPGLAAFRLAEG